MYDRFNLIMFVFLSKMIAPLFLPLGLSILLIMLSFVIGRGKKFSKVLIWAGLIMILISSSRYTSAVLAMGLERGYRPVSTDAKADVIIVLGGGTEPALYPRANPEINGAGDRVIEAYRLWKSGAAEKIILSGGSISWMDGREHSAAREMQNLLLLFGVPNEQLILQESSRNTNEDAIYTKEIMTRYGYNNAILVTSAWHMRRSQAIFVHSGVDIIPAPTDFMIPQAEWNQLFSFNISNLFMNLIPNTGALSQTTTCLREYLGYWVYSVMGWL